VFKSHCHISFSDLSLEVYYTSLLTSVTQFLFGLFTLFTLSFCIGVVTSPGSSQVPDIISDTPNHQHSKLEQIGKNY